MGMLILVSLMQVDIRPFNYLMLANCSVRCSFPSVTSVLGWTGAAPYLAKRCSDVGGGKYGPLAARPGVSLGDAAGEDRRKILGSVEVSAYMKPGEVGHGLLG